MQNKTWGLLHSPGERVRKLKAMFTRGTIVNMQLSPLVSMKSWRVMAVGSMWCSLNGRIKACRTDQTVQQHEETREILTENITYKCKMYSLHYKQWLKKDSLGKNGVCSWVAYLSKDRYIHWSPCVSPPVNKSWRKVCGEDPCHCRMEK